MVELVTRMMELKKQQARAPKKLSPSAKQLLDQKLAITDQQIDALAYGLLGLTEDEDMIVKEGLMRLDLGFFASHQGTNMQAIIDACKDGRLNARARVVISNNLDSEALRRAKRERIPAYHLSAKTHPEPEALDKAILKALKDHSVGLVILAGYMKKVGSLTLREYPGRILNTHPALLPKFGGKGSYGRYVHEAVLASGDKVTGVTIHIADEEYDHGPIVAQCHVPILEGDTVESLGERVLNREHEFFVEVLQKISQEEPA